MITFLETPVSYLKGVGPQRAELLQKELGIFTFGDLLHHFPFRYVDRSKYYKVKEINPDLPYVQIKGKLHELKMVGEKRAMRLTGKFTDDTGSIELVWFQGARWIMQMLKPGTEYVLLGKPSVFNKKMNIVHPEMEIFSDDNILLNAAQQPVYNTTEKLKPKGFDSRGIGRLQKTLQQQMPPVLEETLSEDLIKKLKLISRHDAFVNIHFPADQNLFKKAEFRIKFEELFYNQLRLLNEKVIREEKIQGNVFSVIGNYFNDFYSNHLPFPLTNAQKRVLKEIRQDMGSGRQMNRLLQGDVGSGKTLVALLCMLMALDNGFQACIMAPTEILAKQHLESFSVFLKEMNIRVELLTGSTKTRERKIILKDLVEGKINLLIGTHSLIEDTVQFANLGLVVIDEQHRFGVEQRARLWKKNNIPPHVLVMTATPIPRTLAMTLYGDLDISVIDEMPPGRIPVKTLHRFDSSRLAVWGFLKAQIKLGRQIYIVYPLIEESEKLDYKDLMDGFESISRDFPKPKYQVSIVHGRMKSADKDFEMQRFVKGETHIMVATNVIEVGVNIPNASVMVIESAEKFGLSQLHQLRGRVGRGADQSYCILMSSHKLSEDGRVRMKTMVDTTDGFKIAETDLQLRGAGDIQGTQQSGSLDFRLANLATDQPILQLARHAGIELLKDDPHFSSEKNIIIRRRLELINKMKGNWSRIS